MLLLLFWEGGPYIRWLLEAITEVWSVFYNLKATSTCTEIQCNLGGKIRMRLCICSCFDSMHLNMCSTQFGDLYHRNRLGSCS